MDQLNETISANLVRLRTEAGLTQLQLATKLNYSDKAVSKWERGESIPDIRVLLQLANIYHIKVDDIVNPAEDKKVRPKLNLRTKHYLVVLLSVLLCFFIGSIVFIVLSLIPVTKPYAYWSFIVSALAATVVMTVFSVKWGNRITNTIAVSAILWMIVLIFYMLFYNLHSGWLLQQFWVFFVAGGLFEALIIFWFIFRKVK